MSDALPALAVAALVLQLTPGPGLALVISRAVSEGARSGVISAFGVCTGVLVWSVAAAGGLGEIFEEAPMLYRGLAFAGGCYLLWLAIRHLISAVARSATNPAAVVSRTSPAGRAFASGVLNTLMNPQALVFFIVFLPQFFPDGKQSHLFVGGVVFALSGLPLLLSAAVLSGRIGRHASAHRMARGVVEVFAGSSLMLVGGITVTSAIGR